MFEQHYFMKFIYPCFNIFNTTGLGRKSGPGLSLLPWDPGRLSTWSWRRAGAQTLGRCLLNLLFSCSFPSSSPEPGILTSIYTDWLKAGVSAPSPLHSQEWMAYSGLINRNYRDTRDIFPTPPAGYQRKQTGLGDRPRGRWESRPVNLL